MELKSFLQKKGVTGDLLTVLGGAIPAAVAELSELIKHGRTIEGTAGTENISGEMQLELDIAAHEIFSRTFRKCGAVSRIASEEMDASEVFQENGLSIAFDPLDGSSLVETNLSVGTILGIYENGDFIGRSGGDQIAAAYAVYGPRTTLVLTFGQGTHEFQIEKDAHVEGGYAAKIRNADIIVSEDCKHFSPGNLRAVNDRKEYLDLVKYWMTHEYTLRYSGGMVPDINHTFLKRGGIFTYPGYSKLPQGKLRLLFECAPMALLMEQAGGEAWGVGRRVLDIEIEDVHQRTPIYIGSKNEVKRAREMLHER